jgi:iron complex outermembrane receptor protein
MTSKAISSHAVNSALALALAGVALGAPQMAAAQDAAGTTAQQGDQTFAEIVVTANKREESAQRVPIAITAMSGTQLSTLGVANSIDVAKLAPSVSVSGSYAGQMSQFSIRSVTQNDFNDHVEAPVAVYLDEGYIAMQQGQTFALFDVDRVEILKGPQGTLFGRNATGGLVHYISKKPTKTLDGFVSAEYGAYNTVRLEGAVGGPLGAGVAARLSGYYHRNDGWVKNRYPQETFVPAAYQPNLNNTLGLTTSLPGLSNSGADMGDDNTWALRGQAKFDIGDGSLLLTGFGGETKAATGAYQSAQTIAVLDAAGNQINTLSVSPTNAYNNFQMIGPGNVNVASPWAPAAYGGLRPVAGGDFYGYIDPDGNGPITSSDFSVPNANVMKTWGANANLKLPLGGVNFTAISDFKKFDKNFTLDLEASPASQFTWIAEAHAKSFTQEFRLDGQSDAVKWVAGAYYLHIQNRSINGLAAIANSATGFYFNQPRIVDLTTNSYSLFGQADIKLGSDVTLTAGLRGTRENKDFGFEVRFTPNVDPIHWNLNNAIFVPGFTRAPYSKSTGETLWTGKLGLSWQASARTMVYASVNRGVKAGSFNSGDATMADAVIPYKAEVLWAYEAGLKTELVDRKVRLNLAAYHYDYQNYQASRWLGLSNLITNNDATINGVEAELTLTPVPNFTMRVAAGYNDATVKGVMVGGVPRDVRPTFAPKLNLSAFARYTVPEVAGGDLSFQLSLTHQSSTYHNLANFDADLMPGYSLLDGRIT